MNIIDGKKIAEKIKNEIAQEIFKMNGSRPNLAIILVGERDDSRLYVNLKEEQAKKVGIDTHIYKCDKDVGEKSLIKIIDHLNQDELIDAILVQLPLPSKLNTDNIIARINPAKDVDGFHPGNLKKLLSSCSHEDFIPPLIKSFLEILSYINQDVRGKKLTAVVNSKILGKTINHIFSCMGARVNIMHGDDNNLSSQTKNCDILITALGRPGFIKKDMIKSNAVLIDAGISKYQGKICGDIDQKEIKKKNVYITPVPGGVGPITIATALKNTLALYKKRH